MDFVFMSVPPAVYGAVNGKKIIETATETRSRGQDDRNEVKETRW